MLTQIGGVIHKIENQILDTCSNYVFKFFIALTEAAQETVWMRRLLEELDQEVVKPTVLLEDNQSCIKLLQNEKTTHRTKHVATKFHFVRDLYKSKELDVKYCPSERMIADLLTKTLEAVKTRQFTLDIGLI